MSLHMIVWGYLLVGILVGAFEGIRLWKDISTKGIPELVSCFCIGVWSMLFWPGTLIAHILGWMK